MIHAGLTLSPNMSTASDPVNIVFFRNATAKKLQDHFERELTYKWKRNPKLFSGIIAKVLGRQMFAKIQGKWKEPDVDLELIYPPVKQTLSFMPLMLFRRELERMRLHIRIYECNEPDLEPNGDGHWSIASVHTEHYGPPVGHIIHNWKEPQELIRGEFESLRGKSTGKIGMIRDEIWKNKGLYHGCWFDGNVTRIEIL